MIFCNLLTPSPVKGEKARLSEGTKHPNFCRRKQLTRLKARFLLGLQDALTCLQKNRFYGFGKTFKELGFSDQILHQIVKFFQQENLIITDSLSLLPTIPANDDMINNKQLGKRPPELKAIFFPTKGAAQ